METGQIINLVVTIGVFLWLYVQKRTDKTSERLEAITTRIEVTEKAVAVLQSGMNGLLRHEDLSRVYDAINKLSEQVNKLDGEFKSQNNLLNLILARITDKGMA